MWLSAQTRKSRSQEVKQFGQCHSQVAAALSVDQGPCLPVQQWSGRDLFPRGPGGVWTCVAPGAGGKGQPGFPGAGSFGSCCSAEAAEREGGTEACSSPCARRLARSHACPPSCSPAPSCLNLPPQPGATTFSWPPRRRASKPPWAPGDTGISLDPPCMADCYFSFSKMLPGVPGSRKHLGMGLSLRFKKSFSKLLTVKAFNSENTQISIQSLKRVARMFEEDRSSLGWNVGRWRKEHGRECA